MLNKKIIKTALMGTSQSLSEPWQSEEWKDMLQNEPEEAQLLLTAAYENTKFLTSLTPKRFSDVHIPACEPETLPYIQSMGETVIAEILLNHQNDLNFLEEALQHIIHIQRLIPPIFITKLLQIGAKQEHIRTQILQVTGNRGIWLAQQMPEWSSYFSVESTDQNWDKMSFKKKQSYFETKRKTHTLLANELLLSIWDNEVRDRKMQWLQIMFNHPLTEDEAFLLEILHKENPDESEIRANILGILALIDAPHVLPAADILFDCISVIYHPLPTPKLAIKPFPVFSEQMRLLGLSEKKVFGGTYKADERMQEIIKIVHPRFWVERLQASPEEIVKWIQKNPHKNTLIPALRNAVYHFKPDDWLIAVHMMDLPKKENQAFYSANYLSDKGFVQLIQRLSSTLTGTPIWTLLKERKMFWDIETAEIALTEIQLHVPQNYWASPEWTDMLKVASSYAPVETLDRFITFTQLLLDMQGWRGTADKIVKKMEQRKRLVLL